MSKVIKANFQKDSLRKVTIQTNDASIEALAEQINDLIELVNLSQQQQVILERKYQHLLAEASHDLRTPLTVIRGQLQYILKFNNIDEKTRTELLKTIHQTNQLGTFIDDFFELSLINAPDFPLNPEVVNLNDSVLNELADNYPLIKQKAITPNIFQSAKPLLINIDSKSLIRIINNLLGNAIKNLQNELIIETYEDNHYAVLVIRNDGIKISSEEFLKLFERYHSNTNDQKRRGGLGLAIVSELVKKTNGKLTFSIEKQILSIKVMWPLI